MTLIFTVFFLAALITLAVTRFSSLSVLLMSSLMYSVPVFWTDAPNTYPIVVWCIVFCITILCQINLAHRKTPARGRVEFVGGKRKFIHYFFNIALFVVFMIVVIRSGGIAVFFEGKYGAVPGGSILIYYAWNSLLLVTSALNLGSKKILSPLNAFCFGQIILIFIGGDRTLPILYIIVLLTYYLSGTAPITLLSGRRAILSFCLVVLAPLLAVSKTIYTLLPQYGFSSELFRTVLGRDFLLLATKDFEPTHVHRILVHATSGPVDYSLSDLAIGVFAFFPGSSAFGIEPHKFSLAVKSRYFTTWTEDAGIGAHFWAQGWVVGGFFGVVLFCIALVMILSLLDRVVARGAPTLSRGLSVALIALLGFYIQRNSMEQILSFTGRYAVIFWLVLFGGYVAWTVLPKRRGVA